MLLNNDNFIKFEFVIKNVDVAFWQLFGYNIVKVRNHWPMCYLFHISNYASYPFQKVRSIIYIVQQYWPESSLIFVKITG
jgi:hypothetical protein